MFKMIAKTYSFGAHAMYFLTKTLFVEFLRGVIFYAIVSRILYERNLDA